MRDPTVALLWQPVMYFAIGVLQHAIYGSIYVELAKLGKSGATEQIAEQFA